jgi:lincosamide nucleotidyltransferase A/C/D/E
MPTEASDVTAILSVLAEHDVPVWVAGGWGVDALVGHRTREHADLDVAVPDDHAETAIAVLQRRGFEVTADWLPTRVALTHPDGPEVDVHPLRFRPDGSATLPGLTGEDYEYPAGDFTSGTIDGRPVACISARLQVEVHTGYEPSPKDRADMAVLAAAAGVDLPEAYR